MTTAGKVSGGGDSGRKLQVADPIGYYGVAGRRLSHRPPLVDRVYGVLNGAAGQLGVSALVTDARLERVAKALSGLKGAQSRNEQNVTRLCWLHGLVEPVPTVLNVETTDPSGTAGLELVRSWAAGLLSSGRFRRMGAWAERRGGGWKVVVAVQEVHLDLEPLPRQVPCGRTIGVRGRVERGFRNVRLAVTGPDGVVREAPLSSRGRDFGGKVLLQGKGRHQMEILANGPAGPTVLANFPVYCGIAAPTSFRPTAPVSGPSAPAAAERYLFVAINRERRKRHLGALIWNDVLARVARNHSAEMCQTGRFGHRSRRTGQPEDRVRRAGVDASLVAENVAVASDAAAVHQALMSSPGHRANILTDDVTHVGVGAVRCRMAHGGVHLMVTEVFIRSGR